MSDPYPWILRRPATQRPLPELRPSRIPFVVCGRCGCESKGRRKKCPACFNLFTSAGHFQPAEWLWAVFLLVFVILGLRLLGMAL